MSSAKIILCAALLLAAAEAMAAAVCPANFVDIPAGLRATASDAGDVGASSNLPIRLEADRIDADGENTVTLSGGARIIHGRRALTAERIVYRRNTGRAVAVGGVVFYTARGDRITADALELNVDAWAGQAESVGIAIARRSAESAQDSTPNSAQNSAQNSTPTPAETGDAAAAKIPIRARATAQRVEFDGDDSQRLEQVSLTACAPGNRDVVLRAREIVLDHAAGFGRAKAMTVRFKGAPVFYFPAATFPITDARKTGFLFPAAGYAGDSGLMLEAPYYLNLAPHYDATVTPRLWGKRGAQIGGKFRYLSARGRGQFGGEFLPSDNAFGDRDRHAFNWQHAHRPAAGWRATVDYNRVSDRDYARDFSSEIEVVAASYIGRAARLDYAGDGLRFSAQAVAYQPVDRAITRAGRPYARLPQMDLAWRSEKFGFLRGGVDAQYADFQHAHCGAQSTAGDFVDCGSRLRVKPWLSAPLRRHYGYLEPKISWQTIRYSLDERAPGSAQSPSVEAPIFSLDGGLYFERRLSLGGGQTATQTLEPRIKYVNIPEKRAQRNHPDFDTAAGAFGGFAHLFRENRFFGGDRIGDTEQIAAGVTSRVIDAAGRQRLTLSLGQIAYLRERKITAPGAADAPETWANSGWFASTEAALAGDWQMRVFARRHDRENAFAAFRAAAEYRPADSRRRAILAYTFRHAADEQVNAAFAAPIGARWQVDAAGAYSLETDEIQSASVGVGFDACCWAVRAAAQRYLDGAGAHQNRFLLTFELAGLGGINSGL